MERSKNSDGARQGVAGRSQAGRGVAGEAGPSPAGPGKARQGAATQASPGEAWFGGAGHGKVRQLKFKEVFDDKEGGVSKRAEYHQQEK